MTICPLVENYLRLTMHTFRSTGKPVSMTFLMIHAMLEQYGGNSETANVIHRQWCACDKECFERLQIGQGLTRSVQLFKLSKGTSRQRSGKGAIRKRFLLTKTEVGKNQTNKQVLIP